MKFEQTFRYLLNFKDLATLFRAIVAKVKFV